MTDHLATVLIRAKDEEQSIGRLIGILHEQTVADRLDILVVDSGSTDRTVAIARDAGARVVEMPASEFTFGRALNVGCRAARADIVIALSAHAFPRDDRWAEHMLEVFADERVACACGPEYDPEGRPLREPFLQEAASAERHPFYGYSNSAGGFRRDLWEQRPFREDMPGTEDKEWAWHWIQQGRVVMLDPRLLVDHDHSRDPIPSVFERARREWIGFTMYLDIDRIPLRTVFRRWWCDYDGHASAVRARLSPWRAARLAGEWAGRRR